MLRGNLEKKISHHELSRLSKQNGTDAAVLELDETGNTGIMTIAQKLFEVQGVGMR
jgi:uncharacterized membrane protein YgcG